MRSKYKSTNKVDITKEKMLNNIQYLNLLHIYIN
jgi:hypothetical protein